MIRGYGSAFVGYARDELGLKTEMTYTLLDGGISNKWDLQQGHGQPSVMDDCACCCRYTVVSAHDRAGYSHMVTPYAVTRYLLSTCRRSTAKSAPN